MLQSAGLTLRKWSTDYNTLLKGIPKNLQDSPGGIEISNDGFRKTLDILWSPQQDTFSYTIANIAKIYDPLGWIAPCTMFAKLIMQRLWLTKTNWDELADANSQISFRKFLEFLPLLRKIQIHLFRYIYWDLVMHQRKATLKLFIFQPQLMSFDFSLVNQK